MVVVSVDLAYQDYRDFGIAVLTDGPSGAMYELLPFANGSAQAPTPDHVADFVITLCKSVGASLILIDGAQGWKNPLNGLTHSRLCERTLNTPAKTGLPGSVRPAQYLRFIEFAILVFDAFHERGWQRYNPAAWRPGYSAVVESFPLAAWRSLRMSSLPAKRKARDKDVQGHLRNLVEAGLLACEAPAPTHDQLQAIVAGLAGLGISAGDERRYAAVGAPPFILDGIWREGYIVNPTRDPSLQRP